MVLTGAARAPRSYTESGPHRPAVDRHLKEGDHNVMSQSRTLDPVSNLRTGVFVDGLNLYFGCLKDSPYRWLNVAALCRLSLPDDCRLTHIDYFTAPVSPTPRDPRAALDQETYLRALATLPNLAVHRSASEEHPRRRPLAVPEPGRPTYVTVLERQERGTD